MFIPLYGAGALFVFSVGLNAFLKDSSTPKTHATSWLVLGLATVLWPVTLPSMLRAKLNAQSGDAASETEYLSQGLENSI
ncbi:hypothetical protein IQ268_15570 [Oculatella sp. LEGE 06141]|uniref:hypothetical protein n=1 Tax=Oculatella sp. LEGE 06141 TaxID=1828648 RepID=UPI00187E2070|nr:hypothetical protein [Oculatella sp. LEGE 06141]MBE9179988.1 hypothetical protein [Oculatella sp. LEGE 06141]